MVFAALRALFQFTTILPVGRTAPFEAFARHSYLFPLTGYVTGGIAACLVFLTGGTFLSAVIGMATVLVLSGFNHFDGLLDLGDGLMAHGDRERRTAALTDRTVGAGGIATGLVVYSLGVAGLALTSFPAMAVLSAEVAARYSMAFLSAYGKPFHDGIHSYINEFARPAFGLYALVLCLPLFVTGLFSGVPFGVPPLFLLLTLVLMFAVPWSLRGIGNRSFGGINGDFVGASCEITRAAVLVAAALVH